MDPFTHQPADAVSAWGETKLILALRRWLGNTTPPDPFGIGDDCAVLPPSRHPRLVTVDPVIYGEHFDASLSPRAVGMKLLKRNLSDIAAMGGRPTEAVIALALDPSVSLAWVKGFYLGLATTARAHQVSLVGGDVATLRGGLVATLTLLGEASSPRVLTRQGGQPRDHLFVTGRLGGSLPSGRHWKFQPRLAEGRWLAARLDVHSMLDLSDGLAKDVLTLASPGLTPALDPTALPLHRHVTLAQALTDGEDYELLFTVAEKTSPATFLAAWKMAFPRTPLHRIGQLAPVSALPPGTLDLSPYHGFEHLR